MKNSNIKIVQHIKAKQRNSMKRECSMKKEPHVKNATKIAPRKERNSKKHAALKMV